jgi:drug/metabolite transporter (DMT)-like permease
MPLQDAPSQQPSKSGARLGLMLGAGAVLFWSFGSSLVYMGTRRMGIWRFVMLASLTSGAVQLVARYAYERNLRTAFCLPWRLWAIPMLCFVLYGLAWPWALAIATPSQVFGVNLINYLWPVLTVVFSVWWVPGVRLTTRTVLALTLALAGLLLANFENVRRVWLADATRASADLTHYLPYALAFVAAVTWALYSTILVRWRSWAKVFVTSPLGFLCIGLFAWLAIQFSTGATTPLTPTNAMFAIIYGIGPLAIGYLLWEIALPKAPIQTLSLFAAATPVLSTVWLCLFMRKAPTELIGAALLVSGGVVLSVKK